MRALQWIVSAVVMEQGYRGKAVTLSAARSSAGDRIR